MRLRLLIGVLGLGLMASGAASAATLDFLGDLVNADKGDKTYVPTTVRATLECSIGCLGLDATVAQNTGKPPNMPTPTDPTEIGGFNGTDYADLFDAGNSSDASELAFANLVSGFSLIGVKTDVNADSKTFVSSALYILFKIGSDPNVTIIKNTSDTAQTFTFAALPSKGAGLSHYTEYFCDPNDPICDDGGVGVVPLPATFPMLLAAFGLGGVLLRRRSRAV